MKVYVAASWRTEIQPALVSVLQERGHDVYDFRNPAPGDHGFSWAHIDPEWKDWTPEEFRLALSHPVAHAGFENDRRGLEWCNVLVLVLPSGRSAHVEAGYVAGLGKPVVVYVPDPVEPELMYRLFRWMAVSLSELLSILDILSPGTGFAKKA